MPPFKLPADHGTSVIFLDETGRVGYEEVFGVGCLRVPEHVAFFREIRQIRMGAGIHGELQWKLLDKSDRPEKELEVVRAVLSKACAHGAASFSAVFEHGAEAHLEKRYGDTFEAYEKLAIDAISKLIVGDEVVTVLADRYTPRRYTTFEEQVRTGVNQRFGRLAVANVVRLKSSATDGLQLVDLLLGAVAYDFRKLGQGDEPKQGIADYVLSLHDVPSYRPGGVARHGWFWVENRFRSRGRRAPRPQGAGRG